MALNINKGVGKPVEFRGLKGTYLYLAAGIAVSSLILTLILNGLFGLNTYLATAIVIASAGGGICYCMRRSENHGVSGLLKIDATRSQPKAIIISSAKPFAKLREAKRTRTRSGSTSSGR